MSSEREAVQPVRIQLSRRKGFNLQAVSLDTNGLPAVNVARPSKWGNPFVITEKVKPGTEFKGAAYGCVAVPTVEDAVGCFREMMTTDGPHAEQLRSELHELRGKNLACWCRGTLCHADVLLDLANRPLPHDKEAEDGR